MRSDSRSERLRDLSLLMLFAVSLYAGRLYSYLLFHALVELASAVVAVAVLIVGWNTRRLSDTSFFLFLGVAYAFVAIFDILHLLAYEGMGVLMNGGANYATQLWISGRYFEAFSLLCAVFLLKRQVSTLKLISPYIIVTGLVLYSIVLDLFPVCYIPGVGLTPFKVTSEYIIMFICAVAAVLYYSQRFNMDSYQLRLLLITLILTIGAEFSFTLYISVYDFPLVVGHYLKLFSFTCIYLAVVRGSLTRPYDTIFRDLEHSRRSIQERAELLEASNRELEAFATILSHDIRSPLQAIQASSELILMGCNSNDGFCKDNLQILQDACRRAIDITEGMLRLVQVGRIKINYVPVDLSILFREEYERLRTMEPTRTVRMEIPDSMMTKGDVSLLRLLVSNLLGNAWKYTHKNPDALIQVGHRSENDTTVYYIRDNGIGFDMSESARLFMPFQRLSTATEIAGTGVGLVIAYKVVLLHRGRIWAEGVPGQGATFYFTLGTQS